MSLGTKAFGRAREGYYLPSTPRICSQMMGKSFKLVQWYSCCGWGVGGRPAQGVCCPPPPSLPLDLYQVNVSARLCFFHSPNLEGRGGPG